MAAAVCVHATPTLKPATLMSDMMTIRKIRMKKGTSGRGKCEDVVLGIGAYKRNASVQTLTGVGLCVSLSAAGIMTARLLMRSLSPTKGLGSHVIQSGFFLAFIPFILFTEGRLRTNTSGPKSILSTLDFRPLQFATETPIYVCPTYAKSMPLQLFKFIAALVTPDLHRSCRRAITGRIPSQTGNSLCCADAISIHTNARFCLLCFRGDGSGLSLSTVQWGRRSIVDILNAYLPRSTRAERPRQNYYCPLL